MSDRSNSGSRQNDPAPGQHYKRAVGGLIIQAICFGILGGSFASLGGWVVEFLADRSSLLQPGSYATGITFATAITASSAVVAFAFGYRLCGIGALRLLEDPRKNAFWAGCAGAIGAGAVTWKYLSATAYLTLPAVILIIALQTVVVVSAYTAGAVTCQNRQSGID